MINNNNYNLSNRTFSQVIILKNYGLDIRDLVDNLTYIVRNISRNTINACIFKLKRGIP